MRRPPLAIPLARSLVACVLAVALVRPAAAQFDVVTVDSFDAFSTPPHLFLDPLDGTPHLAYGRGGTIRHAWLEGGVWSNEAVAVGGLGAWAVGPGGRPAALYRHADGSLVCARRDAGAWTPDTIIALPGWTVEASLAIDPVTDEPVVAYMAREPASGPFRRLILARRGASGWELTELDTASVTVRLPSLALDVTGAPRLAVYHARGLGGDGPGAYYGEAATPAGPVTWTRVDETGNQWVSLALDPISGEPRMAYSANPIRLLRYAYRAAGTWTAMTVYSSSAENPATVPSLTLNAAGDPLIVQTRAYFFAAPQDAPGPSLASCGININPPRVLHFDRVGAEGTSAFTVEEVAGNESRSSQASVASLVGNESRVVWRYPDFYGTSPCIMQINYSTRSATTGVPILEPPPIGLAVGPNPIASGATLTVAFRLAADGDVTLELFDLAGRRVARSDTRLAAGNRSLSWSPGRLPSGVYRLVARAQGGELGRRSVIVLR